jgi:putative heme-binding domain-containing protein
VERLVEVSDYRAEAIALSRALGTRPLAQWMLSQPFPSPDGAGWDRVYPPEQAGKPELLPDWTRARLSPDGTVDIAGQRAPNVAVVAYAASVLRAREAFASRLWLGSGGSLKVWLNGKLVHEQRTERPLAARQAVVPVQLASGVNRLLVKVEQQKAGWGFIVELEDPLGRVVEVTEQSLPKVTAPPSERLDPRRLPPDRELLAVAGDASRGREVFFRSQALCANCHRLKDEGGEQGVGPALDGIATKMGKDGLLTAILRPSQSIPPGYAQWLIETKQGATLRGVIVEQTPERLVLKDAQGTTTTVAVRDIEQRMEDEVSAMPADLVKELTRQDLADLLQFLAEQQ